MNNKDHICICICTYKRPLLLEKHLFKVEKLKTNKLFSYSIIIVDNDINKSAEPVVKSFKSKSSIKVDYYNVPEPSFSLVRNKAIEKSYGTYMAFMDDDEYPVFDWLIDLYNCQKKYNVTAILGPVVPDYDVDPPKWLIKSKLNERQRFKTGTFLDLKNTRTGNVLLKRDVFNDKSIFFDPEYGKLGSEDVAFFKNLKQKGHKFIWCDEAIVYEFVPIERMKLNYFIRRAIIRGYTSYQRVHNEYNIFQKFRMFFKSITAVLIYSLLLPFLLLSGFHNYIKYQIRLIEHFIRVLSILKLIKIKNRNL